MINIISMRLVCQIERILASIDINSDLTSMDIKVVNKTPKVDNQICQGWQTMGFVSFVR